METKEFVIKNLREQIEKVLIENNIKFNTKRFEVTDRNKVVIRINFYLDISIKNDKNKDIVECYILFYEKEEIASYSLIIPEAIKIDPEKRKKTKNIVLDFNTCNMIGSFGIEKKSKYISYRFTELLTPYEDGKAIEVNKITAYLIYITNIIGELKELLLE